MALLFGVVWNNAVGYALHQIGSDQSIRRGRPHHYVAEFHVLLICASCTRARHLLHVPTLDLDEKRFPFVTQALAQTAGLASTGER